MSVVFDRIGPSGRRSILVAAWILAAALSPAFAQSGNSGTVNMVIDQARVMKLPDGVATLVVGNPLIADVSVQSGGMVVLTAKSYGVTNLIALDRSGNMLEQRAIQVHGARESVVVYRGVQRESYSCTPNCERRIMLGDSPEFYAAVSNQTVMRNGQAQGTPQQAVDK
jgi:Flp pilus assembly secretin CpaC